MTSQKTDLEDMKIGRMSKQIMQKEADEEVDGKIQYKRKLRQKTMAVK